MVGFIGGLIVDFSGLLFFSFLLIFDTQFDFFEVLCDKRSTSC